jgi:hypothetical protein
VVVRDVLQGIGNALNQIVLADHRHGGTPDCWDSGRALYVASRKRATPPEGPHHSTRLCR